MCVVVCVCVCACMARRHKEGPCINPSVANRKLSPLAVNRTVLCFPSTACVCVHVFVCPGRCTADTAYMRRRQRPNPPLLIMCVSEYGER